MLDAWIKRTITLEFGRLRKLFCGSKKARITCAELVSVIRISFLIDGKGVKLMAKQAVRETYHYRYVQTLPTDLYPTIDKLPMPKINHRFY